MSATGARSEVIVTREIQEEGRQAPQAEMLEMPPRFAPYQLAKGALADAMFDGQLGLGNTARGVPMAYVHDCIVGQFGSAVLIPAGSSSLQEAITVVVKRGPKEQMFGVHA